MKNLLGGLLILWFEISSLKKSKLDKELWSLSFDSSKIRSCIIDKNADVCFTSNACSLQNLKYFLKDEFSHNIRFIL